MTIHNASPSTPSDDLPRVDPPDRVSPLVRAYAAFVATGVGRWLAKNIAPRSTRGCCEPPGVGWPWD